MEGARGAEARRVRFFLRVERQRGLGDGTWGMSRSVRAVDKKRRRREGTLRNTQGVVHEISQRRSNLSSLSGGGGEGGESATKRKGGETHARHRGDQTAHLFPDADSSWSSSGSSASPSNSSATSSPSSSSSSLRPSRGFFPLPPPLPFAAAALPPPLPPAAAVGAESEAPVLGFFFALLVLVPPVVSVPAARSSSSAALWERGKPNRVRQKRRDRVLGVNGKHAHSYVTQRSRLQGGRQPSRGTETEALLTKAHRLTILYRCRVQEDSRGQQPHGPPPPPKKL